MPDKRPPEFTIDEMRDIHDTSKERDGHEVGTSLNPARPGDDLKKQGVVGDRK